MDIIIDYMQKNGIPVTRENYLDIDFMGNPPEELDPEYEASHPPEIQDKGEEEDEPSTIVTVTKV